MQGRLALELFNVCISEAELNSKSATLCANLYNIAKKGLSTTSLI
jgi:hypothetical protein